MSKARVKLVETNTQGAMLKQQTCCKHCVYTFFLFPSTGNNTASPKKKKFITVLHSASTFSNFPQCQNVVILFLAITLQIMVTANS